MALPGHSPPPPFAGPGSPTRVMNGHIDTQLPPMYGPPTRTMLPPSPQNYRFPNPPPIPTPSPSLPAMNDNRNAGPYKRPNSSMSISSMLGGEPDRPSQELYQGHNSRGLSRHGSISAPAQQGSFSSMSPPQQLSKPGVGEYSYKPRSQTPDRIGPSFSAVGARQRSSSSGTPLQRSILFAEPHGRSASTIPAQRYHDQPPDSMFNGVNTSRNEQEERVRRTSLSGILQRPNSQPQTDQSTNQQHDPFTPNTIVGPKTERPPHVEPNLADPFQRNGTSTTYDIKPPGSNNLGRSNGPQISPTKASLQPTSPDLRRPNADSNQGRTLASILNGPPSHTPEIASVAARRMARQDSSQSQSEQNPFGERVKFRQYSPFASSLINQISGAPGALVDEQGRKGSDELSQHRALLGLAAESKRGRYSPMPQVMQGAQAQTPIPDAGVKSERGRVFSGLGGGIGTTPTPAGSLLKKDDSRTPLSEDNLMKMSRSTSGLNKRSRKLQDEDTGTEADSANGGKAVNGRANKKSKHQHSYKADMEDSGNTSLQRRGTPLTGFNPIRNVAASTNPGMGNSSQYSRYSDAAFVFKPTKTIKVASIFKNALKTPRRHLGSFTYRPEISPADLLRPSSQRFDVSIRPNLLPSFSAAEHVNCTYTIHVPKIWLQDRERCLICVEQYLWGSGIYTDDSDPVAAAIHAGFLKARLGDGVDNSLLHRVTQEQNPKIDWPKDFAIPDQPLDIQPGKDLNITLLVLPLLERYESSARFGIKSRMWPEGLEKTQHDGVSFGILNVEFVNVGTEEMRIGRTGISRRERLRIDLQSRQRGLQIQEERIAKAKQKRLTQAKSRKPVGTATNPKTASLTMPITVSTNNEPSLTRQIVSVLA